MKHLALNVIFGFAVACLTGCGTETSEPVAHAHEETHAHHDEESHASFEETLAHVEEMKSEICEAFSKGTPDDAHDLLHDVGHSLEELPALAAKKDGLSADQVAKVESAVEALFDGFGKLDHSMHGGDAVEISDLEKQLSDAISELKEATK